MKRLTCFENGKWYIDGLLPNTTTSGAKIDRIAALEDEAELVVRCKDCKHYDAPWCDLGYGMICQSPSCFCSHGERRSASGDTEQDH